MYTKKGWKIISGLLLSSFQFCFEYCTLRTGTIFYIFFIVFRALGYTWYILNKMPIKLNLHELSCLLKLGMCKCWLVLLGFWQRFVLCLAKVFNTHNCLFPPSWWFHSSSHRGRENLFTWPDFNEHHMENKMDCRL